MSVTLEEIDKFLERLMDEPAGNDYTERLGRKWWYLERKAAETYGCPGCRPGFQGLYNVKHNTVNLRLGKPVVNPKLYEKGVEEVLETFKKYLQSKGHPVTVGTMIDEEVQGVKVSH